MIWQHLLYYHLNNLKFQHMHNEETSIQHDGDYSKVVKAKEKKAIFCSRSYLYPFLFGGCTVDVGHYSWYWLIIQMQQFWGAWLKKKKNKPRCKRRQVLESGLRKNPICIFISLEKRLTVIRLHKSK